MQLTAVHTGDVGAPQLGASGVQSAALLQVLPKPAYDGVALPASLSSEASGAARCG
jgi:hypothetical protein